MASSCVIKALEGVPGPTGITGSTGATGATGATGSVQTGWVVRYDETFSAEANHTFSATGPYTIGPTGNSQGATSSWTANYIASSASSFFQIVNGTGLSITTGTASTNYVNTQRNSPIIYVPIQSLYSAYVRAQMKLRVWVYFAHAAMNVNYDELIFGLEQTNHPTYQNFFTGIQYNGGTTWIAGNTYNQATTVQADTNALTDNVGVVELGIDDTCIFYSGTYSAGWPAVSALRRRYSYSQNFTYTSSQQNTMQLGSDVQFFFSVFAANTSGGFTGTMIEMKVETYTP